MAAEAGKNEVKITNKTHVKPNKKLGRRECQLVTFDLPYIAFYYNQKLLLYKGHNGIDFDGMVGKLKEGLGVVLEEFNQLAGKLEKDEDGVFKVVYDDDMDGVEVIEASAVDVSVDDLTVEEGTSDLKDLIPYNKILNLEGLQRPLLAVQLTKLKDGLAMGLAFNHAILDGTSTWHFMSSWAQICNGSPTIAEPPFLERTKVRNTRVKLNLSPPTNPIDGSNSEAKVAVAPPLRERVFKFSDAAITKIKSNVNASLPSDGSKPFSTFQSLSAHIWRHVTQTRELKPEDYTVFTVFADCRKRVDPPMPESYFGNLIQAVFTVTAAGMLLANPSGFGASMIQKAIEAHNAKAIDERNKEWEKAPKIFEYKDAGVNCVAVGSSPRFKVYGVDFGFGEPEIVRSGSNNRFDGMVYLYQGKKGGIDVEISLPPDVMERLEKDREFLLMED
ncbi:BAHD acyltransferase [Tripterygium wilfordii]|uniref:BAHD acyltransferase n=1 Tax=Tripterygium wilfordii TaxID=458696 RepID=A0A7J7DAY2_TRIWF|nr:BAHD acyltransferase DCR-like [Tripterygium wilfordii]KAF5743517.1 BAHD acyltransferase [Tripterygium wilfordii]